MSSTSISGYIMEAWLVKALRLLYSQKPEDEVRLRKLYKDACENEGQVARMTLTEALRDPKDDAELSHVQISAPPPPPPPPLSVPKAQAHLLQGATTQLMASSDQLAVSCTTGVSTPSPTATATKRSKVAFFNMVEARTAPSQPSTTGSPFNSQLSPIVPACLSESARTYCTLGDMPSGLMSLVGEEEISTRRRSDDEECTHAVMADLVAELACRVCGRLTREADLEPDGLTTNANALVECSRCGRLFHQLCHRPPILGRAPTTWTCSDCQPLRRRKSSSSVHQSQPTNS